jgi:hypothetical protein
VKNVLRLIPGLVRALVELIGIACVVWAAFLVSPVVGFLVLGVGLIAIANLGDLRDTARKADRSTRLD